MINKSFIKYKYTVTPDDRSDLIDKLLRQRDFVEDKGVKNSFRPNLHARQYLAEVLNRCTTIQAFAFRNNLHPVFLTITPPSRLKPTKLIKTKKNGLLLIDNPKFEGDPEYVKSSIDFLSEKWTVFRQSPFFKDFRSRFDFPLPYISTYEPFWDGTAHRHILAFVDDIVEFRRLFLQFFGYHGVKVDCQTVFDFRGSLGYVLKYILKSFARGDDGSMSDEAFWFAKYGIKRFHTSRTTIPLKLYRKMFLDEASMLELTDLYRSGGIYYEVRQTNSNWFKPTSKDFVVSKIVRFYNQPNGTFCSDFSRCLYEYRG